MSRNNSSKSSANTAVNVQQKLIHKLVFVVALATPIMTIPQIYQIWFLHDKGASVVTWTSYVIFAFIWMFYGLETKDKPIIIMQSLCIVTYSSIVIGLLT